MNSACRECQCPCNLASIFSGPAGIFRSVQRRCDAPIGAFATRRSRRTKARSVIGLCIGCCKFPRQSCRPMRVTGERLRLGVREQVREQVREHTGARRRAEAGPSGMRPGLGLRRVVREGAHEAARKSLRGAHAALRPCLRPPESGRTPETRTGSAVDYAAMIGWPAEGRAGSKRILLGCDPGAGRAHRFFPRAFAHLRGRIPKKGAPAPRSGAPVAPGRGKHSLLCAAAILAREVKDLSAKPQVCPVREDRNLGTTR